MAESVIQAGGAGASLHPRTQPTERDLESSRAVGAPLACSDGGSDRFAVASWAFPLRAHELFAGSTPATAAAQASEPTNALQHSCGPVRLRDGAASVCRCACRSAPGFRVHLAAAASLSGAIQRRTKTRQHTS
jgi:hypothetical protein